MDEDSTQAPSKNARWNKDAFTLLPDLKIQPWRQKRSANLHAHSAAREEKKNEEKNQLVSSQVTPREEFLPA